MDTPIPTQTQPSDLQARPSASQFYLKLATMVGLLLLAYWPVFSCGFIWDDNDYVTQNQTLRDVDGLVQIWTNPRSIPQYYPLVHTTFWLEYQAWGLNPLGYHVVNLLLHLMVSLLWWVLLRRMGLPCAWLAAMLFAIHPVHVESVAWITERKNVLSGVFYVLTAITYWQFYLLQESKLKRRWGWYVLALCCFLAALLSKTVTATLPAAMVLVLWYHRKRFPKKDALLLLPFFALGITLGYYTVHVEAVHVGASGDAFDLTAIDRFLLAGRVIWVYLSKLLWPIELVFFYPRWPIYSQTLMAWFCPIGVLAVIFMLLKNRHVWGGVWLVGWLFFIGTLVPVLGFVNVFPMKFSWVADHFQYLASMGILALVALLLHNLHRYAPRIGQASILLILVSLSVRTHQQLPAYRDLQSLWEHVVKHNPGNWAAKNNLGAIYAENGRLSDAFNLFKQSLVINPAQSKGYENLGSYYFAKREWARAECYFKICLEKEPGKIKVRLKCATACRKQGKLEEALAHATDSVRRKPDDLDSWTVVASICSDMKAYDKSIIAWKRAIQIAPQLGYLHYSLGVTATQHGDYDLAIKAQQYAAKLEPELAAPLSQLARLASLQQRWDDALSDINQAHQLEPVNSLVMQRLLWFYVTLPNTSDQHYKKATELIKSFVPSDPMQCQHPKWAQINAAIHARNQQFEQAVRWQERAIVLMADQQGQSSIQQANVNLARYKSHQPPTTP
ncbi:MAG: tetratricopeptide repeat protein [Phycisphaeraceae bacterium JB051]